jgi:prepilin-type N-terminal cleavage/methylation domain-containing protein
MLPRVRLHDEAGFSLAEILVTVVILGIAFAAILGGIITAVTVSDYHRKQATADTVARDAAESVKNSVGTVYVNCATPGSYTLPSAPSGYTVTIATVEYWDGGAMSSGAAYAPTFVGTCPLAGDKGLQRITITAASGDGRASETVQIIKRLAA